MNTFTWKPIYSELASTLVDWRSRQGQLLAILRTANDQGVPVSKLEDEREKEKKSPLLVIDPFTFFAFFNSNIRDSFRVKLLTIIKDNLNLVSSVPGDFNGLPVITARKLRFFSHEWGREPDAIDTLWDFSKAIVQQPPEAVPRELFTRALAIRQVGLAKLTMGMFWMRPDSYLAVDSRNLAFLKQNGIEPDISDWPSYLNFLRQVKDKFPTTSWPELSLQAYQADTVTKKEQYWLFQANPSKYNLVGALKASVLGTWQVNQHRKDIHHGDRVVLWQSGSDAGVYGLATVTSEVGELQESAAEAAFDNPPSSNPEPFIGVTLKVDNHFSHAPILKEEVLKHKRAKNIPVGLQGTNFKITEEQFYAIASMAPSKSEKKRFWLYSPGEQARFWNECLDKKIMVIGYDELGEFQKYNSQSEIEKKIKQLWRSKQRPYNHSRAVWEFANVLQPGDVVITKKGRSEYLGYGVVEGTCMRDDTRPEYKSYRQVVWRKSGTWSADFELAIKTLTDITKYPDYVVKLKKLMNITDEPSSVTRPATRSSPLNVILYGPPGTGKTYELRSRYMDQFTDRKSVLTNEERAAALVKDLSWWEVVALALLDTKEKRASVAQILAHTLVEARIKLSSNNNPRAMIWAALQIHTKEECQNVKYTSRSQPLIFEKDNESVWSIDAGLVETILPGLKLTLNEYHHPAENGKIEQKRFEFVTFHQSFSYEDFIEGIKPEITETESAATSGQINYRVEPGIFKKMCRQALANPGKNFAILIDEINRGNVASIFGELITLIEEDKRLKETNELTTKLPYSREEFGVPNNLYIIGTMNTADRSVEALDTALRRRFTFIEMRPNREKVTQPDGMKVDLRKIFDVINARIERLHDADHCIGHAYFMGIKDLPGLRSVFANKIIPLLREYFYGNPAKVGMVLGERFVKRKSDNAPFAAGSWGFDELDQKEVFTFADPSDFSEEDFQTIYAKNGTGI